MDYQSVVVYTVVNIGLPPRLSSRATDVRDGCATWFTNKIKRAVATFVHSLKLSPYSGILHGNLACMYYKQGLVDLAIDTYRRAIELNSNFPDAYCNLANALKEKGLVAEAEEYYHKALHLCPMHVDTLNNLGNVKREQGKIEEATELYIKALEVFPKFAATHCNLASLLQQQGKLREALIHYRQAINIQPKFADAYSNMGNTLRELQDLAGAHVCFNKAIELNPSFADAYCNQASIQKETGNVIDAINSYRMALKFKPDFPDAYCNLAHCLQIICDWNDYENRMNMILNILQKQMIAGNFFSIHPHHSILYPLSNSLRKEIAARHAKLYCEKLQLLFGKIKFDHQKKLGHRLRIGYVSSDFCNHPTTHLMQSIPGFHNRSKVEVFCYALSPNDGTTFRSKFFNETEHFVDLSIVSCNIEAARIINRDGIHILINMNGYTKGARNEIFALRPAPIQVMWLGYPGTSGADYMDYIVTDNISSPISSEADYTEKFAYMPHTYFVGDHCQMFPHLKLRYKVTSKDNSYTENEAIINSGENFVYTNKLKVSEYLETVSYERLETIETIVREINIPNYLIESTLNPLQVKVLVNGLVIDNGISINHTNKKVASGEEQFADIIFTSRKQYGLPNDAIVYCNFNQLYKIDPAVMDMWVNILRMVPNSYLWLLSFPPEGEPNIRKYLEKLDIPNKRVIFSKVACKEEHVRRGQLADVCLDTPLCNGHTTTMDVMWTGTPVITLPGDTLASRVAASLLHCMNCSELIAQSKDDYQKLAIEIGINPQYRKYIRAKVARMRLESPLFDCAQYTKDLEKLFEKMWKIYEAGEKPRHIKIC